MRALHIAAWCNTAQVAPRPEGEGGWQVIGDPTEGALVVAARKAEVEAHEPGRPPAPRDPLRFRPQGDVGRRPRARRRGHDVHQGGPGGHPGQVRPGVAARPDRAADARAARRDPAYGRRDGLPGPARPGPGRSPPPGRRPRGGPPRGGPGLRRPGRDDRPAARGGPGGGPHVPGGGHPAGHDHRRPPGHGAGDRPRAGHRRASTIAS